MREVLSELELHAKHVMPSSVVWMIISVSQINTNIRINAVLLFIHNDELQLGKNKFQFEIITTISLFYSVVSQILSTLLISDLHKSKSSLIPLF